MKKLDNDVDILRKTVVVSGGFAPFHSGHARYLNHAAAHGQLIVVLNSDQWLLKNKGFIFQDFYERMEVLFCFTRTRSVVAADDEDGTICKNLEKIYPDIYCVGATHVNASDTPEVKLCEKLGIRVMFDIGGPRVQSSAALVQRAVDAMKPKE